MDVALGDVRNREDVLTAARGCDVILHLAATVHDESASPTEHEQVTVGGTKNVVEAAVAEKARLVILLSSVAVYAPCVSMQDESSPVAPQTHYGKAKLAAERIAAEVTSRSSVGLCVLRPAMVYGAGAKGNLARMIAAIRRGLFVVPGRGEARKSVVHVENLVSAIALAAEKSKALGQTYLVTDRESYTVRQIADLISAAVGKQPPRNVPLSLLKIAAAGGDLIAHIRRRPPYFDSRRLATLTEPYWFSCERLSRELGYRPSADLPTSLTTMVR